MFSIVKNIVEATFFASDEHVQVTLNKESKENQNMQNYSFKVSQQKTVMKFVTVYNRSGIFEGYVKVDKVSSVPRNSVIDGQCSKPESKCRDLIVTNKMY